MKFHEMTLFLVLQPNNYVFVGEEVDMGQSVPYILKPNTNVRSEYYIPSTKQSISKYYALIHLS